MRLISPHGGTLVNREVTGLEREKLAQGAGDMPALRLSARERFENRQPNTASSCGSGNRTNAAACAKSNLFAKPSPGFARG